MLRVKKLRASARLPSRASDGAAGLDLFADLDAPLILVPGVFALVPTGIAIALPAGHEGQVRPRSGLAVKHGVTVLNAPGTIDEDYRGEVKVVLINHGPRELEIASGDRIAQLVIAKVEKPAVVEVSSLDDTARGEGGFGSTGR
jgi:dUTP pyrophosphatase